MSDGRPALSGYRSVWLMAMFDLPVKLKEDRRNYARFRKALQKQGFMMLQFSVYARYCGSEERGEVFRKRVASVLPPGGEVRLMAVTDFQFGRMEVFYGKKRKKTEEPPKPLLLF